MCTNILIVVFDKDIFRGNWRATLNTYRTLLYLCHWFLVHFGFTYSGVSWPSGLAYRTQVLVLAAECGFESRP